jgi:hypothetical protein
MLSGALGGSIAPCVPDVVDDMLLCLVAALCLRRIDPVLAGRGPDRPVGPRPATLLRASVIPVFMSSAGLFPPCIIRSVVESESKLKSLDAIAMLLCRSSKLGEGRKS